MNEPELKSAAFALAEATPRHLDHPTTPPIHWRLEGEILRVLLADGRTVRVLYSNRNKKDAVKIITPPAMPTGYMSLPSGASPKKAIAAAKSPANPQRTGTRHKAGK